MSAVPAERLAEAGVWIARLHGDDRDEAVELGFKQWLHASPENVRAFELATDVWEDSQNLRRVVPFAHEMPRKPVSRWRYWLPAAAATVLLACLATILYLKRDGVTTAIGEQRLLVLEDGTRVFLNTATRVKVRYAERAREVELESGEALFDVAKHAGRPFIVKVGDRVVTALGTSFVVRHEDHRTDVTLVEGKISVTPLPLWKRGDEGSVMTPGQRLTFFPGKPVQIDEPSLEKTVAWRRGQVILDDTLLASAVAEMNRYSSVKLIIDRPEAASLLVNGLFQSGDSASFANAVAQTYGLRVVARDGEIVLSGMPSLPVAQSADVPIH
jgi:transmembrane sensor